MKITSRKQTPPLEIIDGRLGIDPNTFQTFAMVRVRMNIPESMAGKSGADCVEYAMDAVREKIK